jgi:nucleoside-diphosphate-sugar epimerase
MASSSILLVGANSFAGSHILNTILRNQLSVFATYYNKPFQAPKTLPSCNTGRYDLTSSYIGQGLPKSIDTIIHVAASASENGNIDDYLNINVMGVHNLLKYALAVGAKRYIFFSSMSVYGEVLTPIVDEDTPIANPSAYGLSKRLGELVLEEYANKLPSVSLRLPSILGRGAQRHWLAGVLDSAKKGEEIDIFNPDANFNNAIDINDLANFVTHLCGQDWRGAHSFPLAAGSSVKVEDAVSCVIRGCKSSSNIVVRDCHKISFEIDHHAALAMGYKAKNIIDTLNEYVKSSL